jgi:hypothetical protein
MEPRDVTMKPVSHAEESDFHTRLHFRTRPITTSTRAVRRLTRAFLTVAARMKFLRSIDLATVLTDETEKILNLKGELPFFPTKTTQLERVEGLLCQLHPISTEQGLVRLGPSRDGGYLVPDDLVGIEACFSPGVSDVSGFEKDCAELGMKVFMADGSVEQPSESHPQFNFIKKFLGSVTQGNFISLSEWVETSLPNSHSDFLLQMDIEGYEYETFLSTPSALLERFRIIVVEFHNLDCLFSEPIFGFYSKAFEKILLTHTCVHIHPNNICGSIKVPGLEIPQLAEFTFLRNDRVTSRTFATQFPHPLDQDNSEKPSLCLPTSCYRA